MFKDPQIVDQTKGVIQTQWYSMIFMYAQNMSRLIQNLSNIRKKYLSKQCKAKLGNSSISHSKIRLKSIPQRGSWSIQINYTCKTIQGLKTEFVVSDHDPKRTWQAYDKTFHLNFKWLRPKYLNERRIGASEGKRTFWGLKHTNSSLKSSYSYSGF